MSQGTFGSEQNRIITAIVLLVLGLLLLLWAWGSWVYRTSPPETVAGAEGDGLTSERLYALGGVIAFVFTGSVAAGVCALRGKRPCGNCGATADLRLPETPPLSASFTPAHDRSCLATTRSDRCPAAGVAGGAS